MNKTVLITGASSGLGKDFATLFAEKGYDLVPVSYTHLRAHET